MKTRIRCPWHQEKTPSLVRRKNEWFCYGSCHRAYTQEEVEARVGEKVDYVFDEEDETKEDLGEKFRYIKALPLKPLRGLKFHSDDRGYFISWPDETYYKYRFFNPTPGSKYVSPRGHKPPLFWAKRTKSTTLWLCEGEINALSIARVVDGDVCSPGSASCFSYNILTKYLTTFSRYSKLNVVVDKDAAGVAALTECRAIFFGKLAFVDYILMPQDANEILSEKGPEGLQKELQRYYPR